MECRVRDIPVYYETYGEGRPFLTLHGWPVDHHHMVRDFEPFFENRSGWKRIYLDLPGMGRTSGADWITNQDDMLEVVLEFIDTVIPGERFVVAGTSYGGYLARGLVYRRAAQMDGVCLFIPQIIAGAKEKALPPSITLVEDPELRKELAEDELEFYDSLVVQSRKVVEAIRELIVPAIKRADHAFVERLDRPENEPFSFDVDRLLGPFPDPTLFLLGRQDSRVGYRDAWNIIENYPRATFAVLDRAGHALGDDQEVLFRVLVNEWLDRVDEFVRI